MKYLVSHQSQQSGPFPLDEIVHQVRAKELELFDYIYDLEKDDWILLMEFAPLAEKLKSNKPGRPPGPAAIPAAAPATASLAAPEATPEAVPEVAPAVANASLPAGWFVLKGNQNIGPFADNDVIKMLQQKIVYGFDLIGKAGAQRLQRISDVPDFNAETIRKFSQDAQKLDLFTRRRFPRIDYNARVIIHDGMKLWRGVATQVSKGGVGLTMENTFVLPGQQLTVHFSATGQWPAFNAVCEVVSKKFVNDQRPVLYGLRFVSLSQDAQDELAKKVA